MFSFEADNKSVDLYYFYIHITVNLLPITKLFGMNQIYGYHMSEKLFNPIQIINKTTHVSIYD